MGVSSPLSYMFFGDARCHAAHANFFGVFFGVYRFLAYNLKNDEETKRSGVMRIKRMLDKYQAHDSRAIANIVVEKSKAGDRQITIMSLIKLVYFAHGWTLGYTGKPLICHDVEAWKFGPVIPEIYRAFGHQMIVTQKAQPFYPGFGYGPYYKTELNEEEADIVNTVYEKYSPLGAFQLSDITHIKGSPWSQCNDGKFSQIPDNITKAYYKKLVEE